MFRIRNKNKVTRKKGHTCYVKVFYVLIGMQIWAINRKYNYRTYKIVETILDFVKIVQIRFSLLNMDNPTFNILLLCVA